MGRGAGRECGSDAGVEATFGRDVQFGRFLAQKLI
jgi:hypothetical protein